MELRYLPNRLEIRFWSLAITLMERSAIVQNVLKHTYSLNAEIHQPKRVRQIVFCAAVGLALGLIIGFLTA